MEKTRICSRCNKEKPLTSDNFGYDKKYTDGFIGQCKECKAEYQKQYREKTNDKIIEYRKQYREKNRDKLITESKQYREENREELLKKKRMWYNGNKEKYAKWSKNYRSENKEEIAIKKKLYATENKAIITKRKKQYYENNKEVISENQKEYYEENKENILQKNKIYYKNNKMMITKRGTEYQKNNPHIYRQIAQRYRAKKKLLPFALTIIEWEKIKQDFNYSCAYCGMSESNHLKENNQQLHQEHFISLSEGGEYTHNNIIPSCRSCNSSKQDTSFFEWYKKYEHYNKNREKFILKYLGYKDSTQQLSIL